MVFYFFLECFFTKKWDFGKYEIGHGNEILSAYECDNLCVGSLTNSYLLILSHEVSCSTQFCLIVRRTGSSSDLCEYRIKRDSR
jgi:hypothetical protein